MFRRSDENTRCSAPTLGRCAAVCGSAQRDVEHIYAHALRWWRERRSELADRAARCVWCANGGGSRLRCNSLPPPDGGFCAGAQPSSAATRDEGRWKMLPLAVRLTARLPSPRPQLHSCASARCVPSRSPGAQRGGRDLLVLNSRSGSPYACAFDPVKLPLAEPGAASYAYLGGDRTVLSGEATLTLPREEGASRPLPLRRLTTDCYASAPPSLLPPLHPTLHPQP